MILRFRSRSLTFEAGQQPELLIRFPGRRARYYERLVNVASQIGLNNSTNILFGLYCSVKEYVILILHAETAFELMLQFLNRTVKGTSLGCRRPDTYSSPCFRGLPAMPQCPVSSFPRR